MKKEIKLVALDMDGTLLDDQKRLSPENKEALLRCLESGVHIVPATGRTWDGVPPEIRELPGVRYAITTNGAMVMDVKENKIIRKSCLSAELALIIMALGESLHVMYDPYIEGRGYTEPRFYDHMGDYGLSEVIQDLVRKTRNLVPNIQEFVKAGGKEVEKVNYFFANPDLRVEARKILAERDDIIVSSSLPNNLEINALGATKGDGLWALADYLGIDRSETMACGDGENDFSMIDKAGIGVAMANGNEVLKEMADFITLSNEMNGVAMAIEQFIFHNKKQV